MIAAAAILFGVGLILAAVGASSLTIARRITDERHARADERLAEIARREQELDALRRRIEDHADQREHDLSVQRLSLENAHAERERMWSEERRELLDRIQAPTATAARLFEGLPTTDLDPAASDAEIDRRYAAQPASAVAWDPDLAPLAGIDPELVTSDETGG